MAPFFQRLSASSRLKFVETSHEVTSHRKALASKISPKGKRTGSVVNHAALDEQLELEDAPLSLFTACALKCANINSESCALGRTKLFFKAGEMGAVDKLLAQASQLSNPSIEEEASGIVNPGTLSDGLNEMELLEALEARKRAESSLSSVSDLWCGVTGALTRISNDEVRLCQVAKALSAATTTMVEAHANAVANDRFKKMKSRAEKLSNLMNDSLRDVVNEDEEEEEEEEEAEDEFKVVARAVLKDTEVVRHAAHKVKSHRDKVSRAVSTVAQQLRDCEKLRIELKNTAKWVTNALLVARSTQKKTISGTSEVTSVACTDSFEAEKFMEDVLLPTDAGDSVCSLFASGLRHARHCNAEEATSSSRECLTILQDILLAIRRHLDEADAMIPRLEDLTIQTESFTKLVLKLSNDAKCSLDRAENYYVSSKDILLEAQVRLLVKEAITLMARSNLASGVAIDQWTPLPLLAIAILNGNNQIADALLTLPPTRLHNMVLESSQGRSGASLLRWLKHQYHVKDCHELEWNQLFERLALVAANPNAPVDADGRSALMLLAWHGAGVSKGCDIEERERQLGQLLLNNGASPFAVDEEGNDAITLAAASGRLSLLKTLMQFVQTHEDPNKVADVMCTSLIAAAAGGAYETATYLVEEGVSVNSVDMDGGCSVVTVAVMAACTSEPPSVSIPASAANSLTMAHDTSPLKHVTRSNYVSPFKSSRGSAFVDSEADRLKQVLAAEGGNSRQLASKPNQQSETAVVGSSYSLVQWLLNQGADVGILDDDGYSPFAVACLRGNITIAELILNHVPINFARRKSTKYGTKSPLSRSFSNSSSGSFNNRDAMRDPKSPISTSNRPVPPKPVVKPTNTPARTSSMEAPVSVQSSASSSIQKEAIPMKAPPTLIRRSSRRKNKAEEETQEALHDVGCAAEASRPEVNMDIKVSIPVEMETPITPTQVSNPSFTPATPEEMPRSPEASENTIVMNELTEVKDMDEETSHAAAELPEVKDMDEETSHAAAELPEVKEMNEEARHAAAELTEVKDMDEETSHAAAELTEVKDMDEETSHAAAELPEVGIGEEEKENRQGKEKKVNAKKLLNAFGGSNKSKGKSLLAKAKANKSKKKIKKSEAVNKIEINASADVAKHILIDEVSVHINGTASAEKSVASPDSSEDVKQGFDGVYVESEDVKQMHVEENLIEDEGKVEKQEEKTGCSKVENEVENMVEVETNLNIQAVEQTETIVEDDATADTDVNPLMDATSVPISGDVLEVEEEKETESPPVMLAADQVYIGMKVVKSFGDMGLYEAVVEFYDESTGWWRVHYEDDEEEDLTTEEVLPLREHWLMLQEGVTQLNTHQIDDEAERALAEALENAEASADIGQVSEVGAALDNRDDDSVLDDSVIDEEEEMVVEEMGDDEWSEDGGGRSSSYIDEATEAMEMVMAAMNRTSFSDLKSRNLSPIIENKSAQSQLLNTQSPSQATRVNQTLDVSSEDEVDEFDDIEGDEEVVLLRALNNYVNLRATDGMTALHLAASENHAPCVEWLLSLGAEVNQRNEAGETPLFTASKLGHVQVVRLLAMCDPEGVLEGGPQGASSILAACLGGHIRCVEALEKSLSSLGEGLLALKRLKELDDVLLEVCKAGHIDIVEHLLRAGADINTCDEYGHTPIMIASHFHHKDLVQYLLHRSCDFVSGRNHRHRGGIGTKSSSGKWE